MRPYLKTNYKSKRTRGMAQGAECFPSNNEALSSIHSTKNKKSGEIIGIYE
jgi:hypothetical protein